MAENCQWQHLFPARAVICLIRGNTGILAQQLQRSCSTSTQSAPKKLPAAVLIPGRGPPVSLPELWASKLEKSTRHRASSNGPVKAHISGNHSRPSEPGEAHEPKFQSTVATESTPASSKVGEGWPETHILQL